MGVLVATALAFGFWRWRQQAQEAEAISARIAAQAAPPAHSSTLPRPQADRGDRGPPPQQPVASAPLPSWNAPLGDRFDDLRRQADAGDPRAACRVGLELARCDAAPDQCPDIVASDQLTAAIYLRKAAVGGNPDAMVRYAVGPFPGAIAPGHAATDHGYLHAPGFEDWYRDAVPMAQRALHAGNPLAAVLLGHAYADDDGLFDAVVPDDPVQADAYALLLSYLRQAPTPTTSLDPRQRARSEMLAQRLYRESFGSRPAAWPIPSQVTVLPDANPGAPAPCQ